MGVEVVKGLGLSPNEAKTYEVLLKNGECSAGYISRAAKLNRRSVYDTIKRLLEKGLVFEILQARESHYRAVDPRKLSEILLEKQRLLSDVMPQLLSLYEAENDREAVYIYRGIEGFKNCLREALVVGQDFYIIAGKATLASSELRDFMNWFRPQALQKGMKFHVIADHDVRDVMHQVEPIIGRNHRFLPPEYSTDSVINIFGDHVVTYSKASLAKFDEDITLSVVINRRVANAYRTWFKFMWNACSA